MLGSMPSAATAPEGEGELNEDQRATWEGLRRGILHMIAALVKARPNDRYTLDVKVVERQ